MKTALKETSKDVASLYVSSKAFDHLGNIPVKYTGDGENMNPPIYIGNIPASAKSLALIVDDPDAPGCTWVHWVVFNIKVVKNIAENSIPGTAGINDFNSRNYGGPCPPSGTHHYHFKVYALDCMLDLSAVATKTELEKAMKNHILAQGLLIGLYTRKR